MCGILGRIESGGRPVSRPLVEKMTRAMSHRGPDEEGYFIEASVGLGHRRLSVIDPVTGRQPMTDESGTLQLVFNGEIFNFQRLRARLEAAGHRFRSRTDSEVVLHLYEEKGVSCLADLEGMFAFGLWDGTRRQLFLARDRLGEKPLAYAQTPTSFNFASEIPALLKAPDIGRAIDPLALDAFLALQYIPAPRSIFLGISKLPAAHYLLWRDGRLETHRYWQPDFNRKQALTSREAAELVSRELTAAVEKRLVSDVPLGAFLSGGLDSSTVVALMTAGGRNRVHTVTAGFGEPDYDELAWARKVARFFRTDHREILVKADFLAELPGIAAGYGEPFGDSSALPTWLLCREAKKEITVALTGDGGDEIFAGYPRYRQALRLEKHLACFRAAGAALGIFARRAGPASKAGWLLREAPHVGQEERYRRWLTVFTAGERDRLYARGHRERLGRLPAGGTGDAWAEPANHLDRMLAADLTCYLPDCLQVKTDIAAMAHGLETRSPFLDHRLVETAATLPADFRLRGGRGKYILRKAFGARLPPGVADRAKHGFGVPVGAWFRGPARPMLEATVLGARALKRGYFEPDYLRGLVAAHCRGGADYATRLYLLVALEFWHRAHID